MIRTPTVFILGGGRGRSWPIGARCWRNTAHGRKVLHELLTGTPIRFVPFEERGRRGFRFEGVARVSVLLGGFA